MADDRNLPDVRELIANRLPISPPVEAVIGTKKTQIAFVLLSTEALSDVEAIAEAEIHKENTRLGLPYEHMHSPVSQNRLTSAKEIRMLHRAIVDPGAEDKRAPMFSLSTLMQIMTPPERMRLQSQWIAWQAQGAIELDEITEARAAEMVEDIKKNGVGSVIRFGSHSLVICLLFLDAQLSDLRMPSSSDGTS